MPDFPGANVGNDRDRSDCIKPKLPDKIVPFIHGCADLVNRTVWKRD